MFRISQLRAEVLRKGINPAMRVTQAAVEIAQQPDFAHQQRMIVTQIAIEFPFTGAPAPPGPPPPPTPTQGDVTPAECETPPTSQCVTQPDIRSTNETCELQGS